MGSNFVNGLSCCVSVRSKQVNVHQTVQILALAFLQAADSSHEQYSRVEVGNWDVRQDLQQVHLT